MADRTEFDPGRPDKYIVAVASAWWATPVGETNPDKAHVWVAPVWPSGDIDYANAMRIEDVQDWSDSPWEGHAPTREQLRDLKADLLAVLAILAGQSPAPLRAADVARQVARDLDPHPDLGGSALLALYGGFADLLEKVALEDHDGPVRQAADRAAERYLAAHDTDEVADHDAARPGPTPAGTATWVVEQDVTGLGVTIDLSAHTGTIAFAGHVRGLEQAMRLSPGALDRAVYTVAGERFGVKLDRQFDMAAAVDYCDRHRLPYIESREMTRTAGGRLDP